MILSEKPPPVLDRTGPALVEIMAYRFISSSTTACAVASSLSLPSVSPLMTAPARPISGLSQAAL
jgi:hypothetical protein